MTTKTNQKKHAGGRPPNPPVRHELLRKYREGLGLSRARLAQAISREGRPVSDQSLYQYERGLYRPEPEVLVAWARALGREASEFVLPA